MVITSYFNNNNNKYIDMKKDELLHHVCEFYMKHNSLSEDTPEGPIVNKITAKVYELKNKLQLYNLIYH